MVEKCGCAQYSKPLPPPANYCNYQQHPNWSECATHSPPPPTHPRSRGSPALTIAKALPGPHPYWVGIGKRDTPIVSFTPIVKHGWSYIYIYIFFFSLFLGPHRQPMEVPRLGVKQELQLPAHTTVTATQDPSRTCELHHSSWQCRILNPLSEAGIEPPSSWILVGFPSAEPQWELPQGYNSRSIYTTASSLLTSNWSPSSCLVYL